MVATISNSNIATISNNNHVMAIASNIVSAIYNANIIPSNIGVTINTITSNMSGVNNFTRVIAAPSDQLTSCSVAAARPCCVAAGVTPVVQVVQVLLGVVLILPIVVCILPIVV